MVTMLIVAPSVCLAAAPTDRHHAAPPSSATERVILPAAGPLISAAFDTIRAHVPRFEARIQRTTATGKACDAKRCWDFMLADPEQPCHGAKLPAFCLTWPRGTPPVALAVPVGKALEAVDPDAVWRDPPGKPSGPWQRAGVALLLLLGPLLVGFGLGRLLRVAMPKLPGIRSVLALVLGVGLMVWGMSWSLAERPHPAPWDVLATSALLFAGAWIGGLKLKDPRIFKLAVFGLIVGLGVTEFGLRKTVAQPRACWHGDEVKILQPAAIDRVCRGAFPSADPEFFARITARAVGKQGHVLHLGDSMVFGSGVGEHETFVAELDRRDPQRKHINASNPDIGPDHLLLTLQAWLAAGHHPKRIAWYIYPGNDLADLDRPSACCAGQALLTYSDKGAPTPTCKDLQWRPHPVVAVLKSAPPYSLQVASRYSHSAAMACAAIRPTASRIGRISGLLAGSPDGGERAWTHLRAVLEQAHALARAKKIALDVVVLPEREGLERPGGEQNPEHQRTLRLAELGRQAGFTVHNAWPLLQQAVRREGATAFFATTHEKDYHLSARGHRLVAQWLAGAVFVGEIGPATATPIQRVTSDAVEQIGPAAGKTKPGAQTPAKRTKPVDDDAVEAIP